MTHSFRLLLLCALVLSGCNLVDGDEACTSELRFGLRVTVQDSLTGAPAASGAQLIARDGSYADTVSFPPNRPDLDALPLASAPERPGTYTVTVRKAGFLDWVRTGVRVTADECHVRPVDLTARLRPAP